MRILLDTHTWIWWLSTPSQLNDNARLLLADRANQLVLSVASAWEIAIKVSIAKLQLPGPIETFIPEQIQQDDIELLPIELRHTLYLPRLPHHHRDPFNRILIAQAMVESLPLLTADPSCAPMVRIWSGQAEPREPS